ncbi:hypothetical protein OKW24_004409 [Peribacillus simplex]|nr:hypothetical protein [Peribacillus simplex]
MEWVADSRIEFEQAKLITLKAVCDGNCREQGREGGR